MKYAKTTLGCVIALGTMGNLIFTTNPITRDDVLIHAAFLLFAGVLIAPEDFKGLMFWRKE